MNYRYVAYTRNDKKLVKGNISGESEAVAMQLLNDKGFQPITIKPASAITMPPLDKMFPTLFKVKSKDVISFTRQLSTLLDAGITVVPALHLIREETTNRVMRSVLADVINDVRAGSPFSEAVAKHNSVFDELYCQVVAVGERTGGLADSLKQAAIYMDKDEAARKKIKRAMVYPVIVLFVAAIVIAILTLFVLPKLTKVLKSFDVSLPLTTKMLISFTDFVSGNWPILFLSLIALVLIAILYFRRPSGRYKFDQLLLSIPLIGTASLTTEMARFSRMLALLVRVGLPLPEALEMSRRTSGNLVVKDAIFKVRTQLLQGEGLSAPMSKNKIFPRLMVQMVTVGEESGKLESTLETAAISYEVEADDKINQMISMIEPAMILVVSVLVGFIAISTITPMYSITDSIK